MFAVQPDHYLALGIQPEASLAEVRAAYLRVMRESHPDVRPGDEQAALRAREANAAWEVLSDAARRGAYDRLRRRRQDGSTTTSVVVVRSAAEEARLSAYREQMDALGRRFRASALKVGAAICLVGLGLLAGAASVAA